METQYLDEISSFDVSNKRVTNEHLKRARTYAGSSSMVNPMRDLGLFKYPEDKKVLNTRYHSHDPRYQDENIGVDHHHHHHQDSNFIHLPQPTKLNALQPRLLNSDDQQSFKWGSITSALDLSHDPKSPISYSTLLITNDPLLTLKNENTAEVTDEEAQLIDNEYNFTKHSKFTNAEVRIPAVELSDSIEPLNLTSISNKFLPDASPFYQTREFNPVDTTDTGILLKILNYEFENVPDESDEEGAAEGNDIEENNPAAIPWYRSLLNFNFFKSVIDANRVLTKEEYNAKYPWDKFYNPELFENSEVDDENVLNKDMIPESYYDTIANTSNFSKKQYTYIFARKRVNTAM